MRTSSLNCSPPPSQPTYKEILNDALGSMYFDFCHKYKLHDGEDININIYAIEVIIKRCIRDFDRLSTHHNIEEVNSHKIAGYLTYWVCRLLPINILNYELYKRSENHYLNQIYALLAGCTIINHEKRRRFAQAPQFNVNILKLEDFKDIFMDYIYTAKFCELNPDLLSMIYYFADSTAKAK